MRRHKLLAMLLLTVAPALSCAAEPTNRYLDRIVRCESGGSHYWKSDGWYGGVFHKSGEVKCGDDGVSCGIGQFSKTTFYWLTGRLRMKHMKWLNREDQLEVMNAALNHGYGRHWSCYWEVVLHKHLVARWIHGKKHYLIVN